MVFMWDDLSPIQLVGGYLGVSGRAPASKNLVEATLEVPWRTRWLAETPRPGVQRSGPLLLVLVVGSLMVLS